MPSRSKPSDGVALRVERLLDGQYALCAHSIARRLHMSKRSAWRYITKLLDDGIIYPRYNERGRNYFSLTRYK